MGDGWFGLLPNQLWLNKNLLIVILVSLSQFSLTASSMLLVNGTNRYVMTTDNSLQSYLQTCNSRLIPTDNQFKSMHFIGFTSLLFTSNSYFTTKNTFFVHRWCTLVHSWPNVEINSLLYPLYFTINNMGIYSISSCYIFNLIKWLFS